MFSPKIINKLQEERDRTFSIYRQIKLDRPALVVVARLLLNPDCRSDIDILSLPGEEVRLFDLGKHIITAAPSTLAQYADEHDLLKLTKYDVLRCFALDHIRDVNRHEIDTKKNPQYALAHILNLSKITGRYFLDDQQLVDLSSPTSWGQVKFKQVVVPNGLQLEVNELVFHHFGVVVAKANDEHLSLSIKKAQQQDKFMNGWWRHTGQKEITVDFADTRIFHKDILGQILDRRLAEEIKQPGDLSGGKIKFKN